MSYAQKKQHAGLTLIEMLITLAIISIIAATIFSAIDPRRRLNTARNTKRWTDVVTLVDALKAYQADHDGTLCMDPNVLSGCEASTDQTFIFVDNDETSVQIIGEAVLSNANCAAYQCASVPVASSDCTVVLSTGGKPETNDNEASGIPAASGIPGMKPYLAKIPADPGRKGPAGINDSRYYINYDSITGVVTVGACDPESQASGGQGVPDPIELAR